MRLPALLLIALPLLAGFSAPPSPTVPEAPPLVVPVRDSRADIRGLVQQAMDLTDAGRLREADAAIEQAIAVNQANGARNPGINQLLLTVKGRILMQAGQFEAAETMLKQVIVDQEATTRRGREMSSVPYSTLGELYMRQARWAEAEPLLQQSVAILTRFAGKNDPATAEAMNTLAVFYLRTGQNAKAERLLDQVLAIFKRDAAHNQDAIASVLVNLGAAYQNDGDGDKALDYYEQAYRIDLKLFGPEHPNTNLVLSNSGVLLGLLGRYDEAAPLLDTVLKYTEDRYGADNVQTAHQLNNIGWVELGRKNDAKAIDELRRALAIYIAHRDLQKAGPGASGAAVDEREVARTILGFLRAADAQSHADPAAAAGLLDEAFQAAQQVHRGKAAEALALTTARFATGDGALAQLIREAQDLSDRSRQLDQALTGAFSLPDRQRDKAREAAAREELGQMRARIAAIDAEIGKAFPDYARLADPKPLTVADAQALLRDDEAMVLVAPFGGSNGEGLFTFVVSRDGAAWRSGDIGQTALTDMVRGLRCGLDIGQWDTEAGRDLCGKLTGVSSPKDGLPFDAGLANRLFSAVFGDLAPRLDGKTLLIVAPDPLASLPFQVLVTAPPAMERPNAAGFQDAAWLGRSNPIAVLPSAGALRGMRAVAVKPAPQPFIGFGDPTLSGGLDCPTLPAPTICPVSVADASTAPAPTAQMVSRGLPRIDAVKRNGGAVDLDSVRSLCPLPETALELRCVSESVHAGADTVRIGEAATVPAVLSAPLDQYRILHFATHGLLAGDMETEDGGVSEPALVLTPPDKPTPGDDGLLRASQIATLKLNADWVVLSACNTAAGSALGGEAMSGLASAFFYAGARALLVSHWPVRSDAAVLLTTAAFADMSAHPGLGRAEAMRDAMELLIDVPSGAYAHPAVWAPFSVVGESGPASF